LAHFGFYFIEGPARCLTGASTGIGLPAPNNRVYVERLEFDSVAPPAGALGRDHRGAAPEENIEHDVASRAPVCMLSKELKPNIRNESHSGVSED
jgi:hypothetical protein